MTFFKVLTTLLKQSLNQAIQSASDYTTRIGFSDSLFLLSLLCFPIFRLVSFLLQSIVNFHVAFLPFVMIGTTLLLFISGTRLRGYLIAFFYRLLDTTLAQVLLYYCLCFEQIMHSHIAFSFLMGSWLTLMYIYGVLYEHTLLLPNILVFISLVYYRLRRRLWNDDAIHFVSTPRGVLWSDALHGLDTSFRARMVTNVEIGVRTPHRIRNRLSDQSNIAFPFLIRKRGMRTTAQESARAFADWIAQNPAQAGAIAATIGTGASTILIDGWREASRRREQMEVDREHERLNELRHKEQMEVDREREQVNELRYKEQMEERFTRSIQRAKERYSQNMQTLEQERSNLDSVWRQFSLDKPQMLKLNEKQIQEVQANFEAYQKEQEQWIHSIRTKRLPNSKSVHGGQREEQTQSTVELIETQAPVSSSGSLAITDYSSFLSQFL